MGFFHQQNRLFKQTVVFSLGIRSNRRLRRLSQSMHVCMYVCIVLFFRLQSSKKRTQNVTSPRTDSRARRRPRILCPRRFSDQPYSPSSSSQKSHWAKNSHCPHPPSTADALHHYHPYHLNATRSRRPGNPTAEYKSDNDAYTGR